MSKPTGEPTMMQCKKIASVCVLALVIIPTLCGCWTICGPFSRSPGYSVKGVLTDSSGTPLEDVPFAIVLATTNGLIGPIELTTATDGCLSFTPIPGPHTDSFGCPPPAPEAGAPPKPVGVILRVDLPSGSLLLTPEVTVSLDGSSKWTIELGEVSVVPPGESAP